MTWPVISESFQNASENNSSFESGQVDDSLFFGDNVGNESIFSFASADVNTQIESLTSHILSMLSEGMVNRKKFKSVSDAERQLLIKRGSDYENKSR